MANYLLRQGAWLTATVVGALEAATYLDNHIAGHLIWGGTVCDTAHEMYTCAGYPPTGLMLLFLASGAGVLFGSSLILDDTAEIPT